MADELIARLLPVVQNGNTLTEPNIVLRQTVATAIGADQDGRNLEPRGARYGQCRLPRAPRKMFRDSFTEVLTEDGEHDHRENTAQSEPRRVRKTKITSPIVAIFLLFTSANSLADSSILMTPEFTITEREIIPTKKWVILDSFATILQCNDRRSSLIRQIDKERRETGGVEDHTAAQTDRELRLLWHIYTSSKCVSLAKLEDFK